MLIKALRPLHGDYGSVVEGQLFDARFDIAEELIKRGLAVIPENKSVTPPETQARRRK